MEDPESYVKNHFESAPTFYELKQSIGGLDDSTIYVKLGAGKSAELLNRETSTLETVVKQFICEIDLNIIIQTHIRNIISPKEIDLYLPEYRIGIEINPTYTHNSSLPSFSLENKITPINYHKMKTDMCEEKDIFLFHIFGYEWTWKQDIIKSMLRNLLGNCTTRYYARNLHIKEIDFYRCKSFLNVNHRQGFANSSVRLGLLTNEDELVSVMTFGKVRNTIGKMKSDTDNSWELIRFCSKLNTSVVGGASKLFKYFIRNYSFDKIISFSDRAHTRGTLYEKLGFKKVNISDPNYVWVNYQNDFYYNRVTCQKRNLPKLFNEPDLDIENQTEKQIMMTHGFVQVFDSGTVRWEYVNNLK